MRLGGRMGKTNEDWGTKEEYGRHGLTKEDLGG